MTTRTFAKVAVMLCAAGAALLTPGCAQKKPEVWIPSPIVDWDQIATQPVGTVHDGYRILVSQPTKGLFPASIAVTRLALQESEDPRVAATPILLADPRNEFLQWNSALDNLMAISEVYPVVQRDLGGGVARPGRIVSAFRALHAQLGLVYAVNDLSPHETEMLGVLYYADSAHAVASIHALARSVPPPEGRDEDEPVDLWKTDSRALVRARFEEHLHACIRDLIAHDDPAEVEASQGWTPAGPIRPVEWPPRWYPQKP